MDSKSYKVSRSKATVEYLADMDFLIHKMRTYCDVWNVKLGIRSIIYLLLLSITFTNI